MDEVRRAVEYAQHIDRCRCVCPTCVPDPTVHALAVLGARCVRMATLAPRSVLGEVLGSPLVEYDGWRAQYASKPIAATVAALTGGSDAA